MTKYWTDLVRAAPCTNTRKLDDVECFYKADEVDAKIAELEKDRDDWRKAYSDQSHDTFKHLKRVDELETKLADRDEEIACLRKTLVAVSNHFPLGDLSNWHRAQELKKKRELGE